VVVAPAAAREVTVVGLAALRVVAVVPGARLEPVAAGAVGAVVVADVSLVLTLELVVLSGGPAMANWPPRRNAGGPLWVSL
jgi:hypothetical protein